MSQRRYGHAPFPDDGDSGRRSGLGEPSASREAMRRSFGPDRRESPAPWDDAMDPQERDRLFEDRARPMDAAQSPAKSSRPHDSGVAAPASRWSSPSRRRQREHPRSTDSFGLETPDADLYGADFDDAPIAPWSAESDHFDSRLDARAARYRESDVYDDPDLDYQEPAVRYRARRAARPRPTIVMPRVQVPASVAGADIVRDPVALALLGAGVILALISALVTFSRVRRLPESIELRYDAYGLPTRWGPPESLWQLPLLVAMVTIISLVIAVAVSRHDRFASRFLLAAALVVGLLTWVPLARFLW